MLRGVQRGCGEAELRGGRRTWSVPLLGARVELSIRTVVWARLKGYNCDEHVKCNDEKFGHA